MGQKKELYIRLTQENSKKKFIQTCLPYITYCYNIIVPEASIIFYHITWVCAITLLWCNSLLSEFKTIDSNYFLFFYLPLFSFIISLFFYLYFWGLMVRVQMTSLLPASHMTKVTVMCHMEKYRRFWKNDVRPYVDLKANTWLFRVG